jgi:hypothetical protein
VSPINPTINGSVKKVEIVKVIIKATHRTIGDKSAVLALTGWSRYELIK